MASSDKWKALERYLSCENVLGCFQSQLQESSETQVRACFGQNPCIVVILGLVRTNAFSFENAYNLMRLGLCPHINTLSVFVENASIESR